MKFVSFWLNTAITIQKFILYHFVHVVCTIIVIVYIYMYVL